MSTSDPTISFSFALWLDYNYFYGTFLWNLGVTPVWTFSILRYSDKRQFQRRGRDALEWELRAMRGSLFSQYRNNKPMVKEHNLLVTLPLLMAIKIWTKKFPAWHYAGKVVHNKFSSSYVVGVTNISWHIFQFCQLRNARRWNKVLVKFLTLWSMNQLTNKEAKSLAHNDDSVRNSNI